jgi:hypothetical protein
MPGDARQGNVRQVKASEGKAMQGKAWYLSETADKHTVLINNTLIRLQFGRHFLDICLRKQAKLTKYLGEFPKKVSPKCQMVVLRSPHLQA